ncbi:MAG: efflux RND transporter permease subunit [Marinilabiliaceae bacterium]|nr:efflux RND transporter permease subunit [Marinilabiliaceae bacterium]
MIDFLIRRPIAVFMTFLAFVVLGIVAYNTLPVSLLPNIAIPQITVKVNEGDMSAQEIENSIVSVVRRQLLQVQGLSSIRSTVRDGIGIIDMRFEFGTNTDLAFIEVNEKIDGAMGSLGNGVSRPKAIKASATDIPVCYINMTLTNEDRYAQENEAQFLEMCDIADNIVRRRIEQMSEVAMADVTGIPGRVLNVEPNVEKMKMMGVTQSDIENALNENNIDAGSMTVNDGHYQYTIRTKTVLSDKSDVGNIYIRCGGRLIQLKDFCRIVEQPTGSDGRSLCNGKRAVTFAVIKQSDDGMNDLKDHLNSVVAQFSKQFPEYEFTISRNQTELLDYSISNLEQNLILGFILIMITAMLFMRDFRTSIVIGIAMLVAVILTFIPFFVGQRSLNIVSLSGMILVVGMMIDSAIIVAENIMQWRASGRTMRAACVRGTNEMISPMLSSTLTTVAVFLPLIFLNGMAGAIFTDQAFAITSGLAMSYVAAIILLPVLYKLIGWRKRTVEVATLAPAIARGYDRGASFCERHRIVVIAMAILTLPMCYIVAQALEKSRMPEIDNADFTAHIDWNSNISVAENNRRVLAMQQAVADLCLESSASVGSQDYMLGDEGSLSTSEAELYWLTPSVDSVSIVTNIISNWITNNYPEANITFAPPASVFEQIFDTGEPDICVELSRKAPDISCDDIRDAEGRIVSWAGNSRHSTTTFRSCKTIVVDRELLSLYNVGLSQIEHRLKSVARGNDVTTLKSYSYRMPIRLTQETDRNIENEIKNGYITSYIDGRTTEVPLRILLKITTTEELKDITAGKDGEYIPIMFYGIDEPEEFCKRVRAAYATDNKFGVDFSGAYFSNIEMISSLIIVLLISVLLMYFILCAQFESFVQPLIVLIEIPIDTSFALLVLWLLGDSLNLMSGIGIIVSCGIIVNDSILKIDSINELRKLGMPMHEAIHTAGKRRIRAIIMTSLTTIGAMLPVLFTNDMGSDLQRPLAITMIATMLIGTLVSIFVVPVIYALIEEKKR